MYTYHLLREVQSGIIIKPFHISGKFLKEVLRFEGSRNPMIHIKCYLAVCVNTQDKDKYLVLLVRG